MASAPLSSPDSSRHPYVVTRPRLHRGHFAYLRAVVQGLSPRAVWERYLPDAGDFDDTPRVHRMTGWIRAELAAAAARTGDFGQARLLRLDLAPAEPALPSLEAFVARQGLEGVAQAEQLAAYTATYGSASAHQRRRTALMHRQVAAIHTLEARVAQPVALGDGVEAWIVEALAQRLKAAGIPTLHALRARMAERRVWWRDLRGIGPIKAFALAQFVGTHFAPVEPGAGDPATGTASALMPIDRLVLPADLSGQHGRFRAPRAQCLLTADDDRSAIQAWLGARGRPAVPPSAEPGRAGARLTCTQQAYRKEAERFLLWAVRERRCALSSVTVEDCLAYRDFLLAPPPGWCGPRAQPRWNSLWRPFAGPLSPRSCAYALGVLGNLFTFLVDQGYVVGNPWRAVVPPRAVHRGPEPGRGLTLAQWQFVWRELTTLRHTVSAQRLQFALPLLHETGLRLSELLAATTEDLHWEALARPEMAPLEGWWLTVQGKGGRVREVSVSPDSLARLRAYLVARGLSAELSARPAAALVGAIPPAGWQHDGRAWNATQGVTGMSFHRQLKAFFARCAQRLGDSDAAGAERLRRASTHWLRHTHVWHALDAGVPVEVVQQNVGHVSLDTTSRYVKTEQVRRLQAMQQLWQSAGGRPPGVVAAPSPPG